MRNVVSDTIFGVAMHKRRRGAWVHNAQTVFCLWIIQANTCPPDDATGRNEIVDPPDVRGGRGDQNDRDVRVPVDIDLLLWRVLYPTR